MTHGNFDVLRMLSAVPQFKPRRQDVAAEIKSKKPVAGRD
jgi:hypothetical protein